MLAELGGIETARRLIRGSATSGSDMLWEHSRLDLSVEALVTDPHWRPLFSDEEAGLAGKRLKQYGYAPATGEGETCSRPLVRRSGG
jgi:hypothetical protein